LAELWAQQVVIENRPGAGGNIASRAGREERAEARPGSSATTAFSATNQSLYAKLGYARSRISPPVALVAIQPNILVVNPNVPQAR